MRCMCCIGRARTFEMNGQPFLCTESTSVMVLKYVDVFVCDFIFFLPCWHLKHSFFGKRRIIREFRADSIEEPEVAVLEIGYLFVLVLTRWFLHFDWSNTMKYVFFFKNINLHFTFVSLLNKLTLYHPELAHIALEHVVETDTEDPYLYYVWRWF